MQLDNRRTHLTGRVQLGGLGIHEQADHAAGLGQGRDGLAQARPLLQALEATLGGHLAALLRHNAERLGPGGQGERQHLLVQRALEVQEGRELGAQPHHIGVLDVPPVLAQVAGDPIRARPLARQGPGDGVGEGLPSCLPQGCDMIDIDMQAQGHGAQAGRVVSEAR